MYDWRLYDVGGAVSLGFSGGVLGLLTSFLSLILAGSGVYLFGWEAFQVLTEWSCSDTHGYLTLRMVRFPRSSKLGLA